jgi:hypothetical protein
MAFVIDGEWLMNARAAIAVATLGLPAGDCSVAMRTAVDAPWSRG